MISSGSAAPEKPASKGAVFLEGSLMRHVVTMSSTASIGLAAMFAVDFIDIVFISMLGNDALAAAVGYAGTLLFFTNSINIGLSIAAGSLVSRAIGADQTTKAREYATSVAVLTALGGIFLPLLILLNLTPLLEFLGARGEVLQLAARYVTFILPTMWVLGIAMTAMAVLRAYGDAKRSMTATLFGGTVNAILDPLLIFGVGLGLDGAAIASVAARAAILAYALLSATRVHDAFARPSLAIVRRDYVAVSAIGLPAVLTNVATPVGNAIVTREIAQFGTDAVAGMAVIGRLIPVAFAVIFALSGAIGPIIGQNFGAGRFDRVRTAFNDGITFTAIYVVVISLLLYVLRSPIAGLFNAEGEMQELIYLFCGPLALFSFFNGLIFVGNASFNNLGKPIYSTIINWGRHTVGTWPFVIAGGAVAGASGVLIGQALGGVIFGLISWFLAYRVMDGLAAPSPPESFAGQRRLHSLFGHRWW